MAWSMTVRGQRFRFRPRTVFTGIGLVCTLLVCGVVGLMVGDYGLSPAAALAALWGTGNDQLAMYFVGQLRLPRVLVAMAVGAALGTAGAIFQGVTRNPLGSPDITGFSSGAATGALLQILVFGGGPLGIGLGAVLGGFTSGALVFAMARHRRAGGMDGMTFVLCGLGLSFILQALNSLLIVRASVESAYTAAVWLAGSFNVAGWWQVLIMGVCLLVLLPVVQVLGRDLNVMAAGEECAAGVGVNVARSRTVLIALGVILVAVAVSVSGPIGFVALAAPQLAVRLSRAAGSPVGLSALMGATVVLISDLLAQRLFAPTQLPVGVITGVVGGVYLLWLLTQEWKERS